MSKKELQKITRKLAAVERRQQDLLEIERLADWLLAAPGDDTISFAMIRANLAKVERLSKKVGIALDPAFVKEIRLIESTSTDMAHLKIIVDRWVRITEQRAQQQTTVPPTPLCIRCNHRQKHFDDYCKRCAEELGIRPTGKI